MEILENQTALAGQVVVIGGAITGLDAADFLSKQGAHVTIIEAGKQAGSGLEWYLRKMRLKALRDAGVKILVQFQVAQVQRGFVVCKDQEGTENRIPADETVAAIGSISYNPFGKAMHDLPCRVTFIGDCRKPSGIAQALSDGLEAGQTCGSLSF